jgi:hypothetical protein
MNKQYILAIVILSSVGFQVNISRAYLLNYQAFLGPRPITILHKSIL